MNACPESIGELSIIITEDTVTEACLIMLHRHSLSRRYRYSRLNDNERARNGNKCKFTNCIIIATI